MRKLFVLWLCGQGIFAFGQEVNKEFTKLLLNEQFDNVDKNWNTTFNADNLFIGQNGYYELYRLSSKSGYYVIANNAEEYSAFELDLHLVFGDHKNKKQSAGVLMMAQSESSGGISVEINQKKEYRIVRVYKDKQIPLSGTGTGWKKASTSLTKGENTITIKTYDKVYDLYFNGTYIQSFTDIELSKGKLGLYIGPDSKARFDYLKVLGEEKKELAQMDVTDSKSEEESFTQIIVKLKDQINKREKEIDEYKTKLKLCESGSVGVRGMGSDTALVNQRNKLLAKVTVLEEENEELKMQVIGMEEEIKKLEDFKQGVEKGNENGDIIINLTNMVSNQRNTIDALEKMNKILNNENNSLFIETKELIKQMDKTTNQLTAEQQKNKLLMAELDSMKKVVLSLQDSLTRKNSTVNGNPPEKELSEEEKLRILIEKEREERRKKKEEEELRRKEEEEKQKNGGNGNG